MTLAKSLAFIQADFSGLGVLTLSLAVGLLLLNLDDVDTEALLVRGVDLAQEPEGGRFVVDLRHDLAPRFGYKATFLYLVV